MIDKPNGDRADIRLIRSVDWIETHNAKVGGEIFLDLPHMGARGFARVVAIDPCPPLGQGAGRLVTGTFRHTSGEVYDLKLASESKPIGVTATHPFWSVDRNAWVSAIDLEIGETLKTLEGTTVVESLVQAGGAETVYNIEVEGDHVYRVGERGVLVHNQSPGQSTCSDPCADAGLQQGYTAADFDRTTVSLVDENGRNFSLHKVMSVLAWLNTASGTDATTAATNFVRFIGKPNDDAGHVIGRQFGGRGGKRSGNIFPQQPLPGNRTTQRTRENQLAAAIDRPGKRVCVELSLDYNDPNLPHRPSSVNYEAWIDGVKQNYPSIRNP